MASHMRQDGTQPTQPSRSTGQPQQPAGTPRHANPSGAQQPVPNRTPQGVPNPTQVEPLQRQPRFSDSSTAGQSLDIPERNPHRKWPAILVLIAIIVGGLALVWLFVGPQFLGGGAGEGEQPGIEEGAEGTEGEANPDEPPADQPTFPEQSNTFTSESGTAWTMTSDLATPVELQSVSDDGVALRFMGAPDSAYVTVQVTSCEVNGEPYDTLTEGTPLHYTVLNESTGETVETEDPLFITAGGEGAAGTVITVKIDGLTADQYDSVSLKVDEDVAKGDLESGDYTIDELKALTLTVRKG